MTIFVNEIFWLDQKTKRALLNFLWSHRDHRKYAAFTLPVDEPVVDFLIEPRIEMRVVRPNAMLRVIDVITVLEKIGYPLPNFKVSIQIIDELCPWNNGCFSVSAVRNKVSVKKIKSGKADLVLNIEDFSQLVTGFRTIHQLLEFGSATIKPKKEDLIGQLFAPCTNFLRDFF